MKECYEHCCLDRLKDPATKDSQIEIEVEPCDQKELTKSLYYDTSSFTNMTCIKDEKFEVLQGLLYDYNKTIINIDL